MTDFPMLAAIVADPFVQAGTLAVVGALLTHVVLRHHPGWRLAGQVAFFLALTLLLTYHGIVPYEATSDETDLLQRVFIGLAKVIWWVNATLSLAGFVRVFLIFEGQPREGRLIQDLIVGIIYVGSTLSVVAYVFSFPVGTLIATSGVFAIILGLALQSTLSDVFSGVALNIGNSYAVGDWIRLSDGVEGRVLETNWRATHLLSGTNDLIIVPNSNVAKATLTNLSRPDKGHGVKLTVRLRPTVLPSVVANVMRNVLLSSNSILTSPAPSVSVKSLDGEAIEMELSFRVPDIAASGGARNEIFDLIHRHTKAAGLGLSQPAGSADTPAGPLADAASSAHRTTRLKLLDAVPLFSFLTEDEKEALADAMTRRNYRKDEVVAQQGIVLETLMIVRSGVLVAVRQEGQAEVELSRMAPGDCFGEGGLLTGAGEAGTIRALTFVVVYEIAKDALAQLMHDRPGIADELGTILAQRAAMGQHPLPKELEAGGGSVAWLAARIRQFLRIPHA
jgi:small-conductance mechanosensitive channel